MTAVCGGGTSSNRSGFSESLFVGPAMIGAVLNNIPTIWAVPLAGYIGAITYNLSTFCSVDPPAVPTITAADVIDLLNVYNPVTNPPAASKFQQLIGAYLWYQVCQCDSVATPAPPTPLPAPTGMPSINPPALAPTYPTGQPCASFTYTNTGTPPNTPGPDNPILPLPTGATHARMTLSPSRPLVTADATGYAVILNCFNAAGTFIGNPVAVGESSSGVTDTAQGALPAGTAQFRASRAIYHVDTPIEFTTVVDFFCGAQDGGGAVPQPCPADPFLTAQVDRILQLVTLMQRQISPFAYIQSTAHSALTGSGSISVQGLIGALVEVTARGSNVGELAGDPDVLFSAGWVNWGNGDGVTERQLITADNQVSFPLAAGQFTSIHYSANVGVTLRITELVREP